MSSSSKVGGLKPPSPPGFAVSGGEVDWVASDPPISVSQVLIFDWLSGKSPKRTKQSSYQFASEVDNITTLKVPCLTPLCFLYMAKCYFTENGHPPSPHKILDRTWFS